MWTKLSALLKLRPLTERPEYVLPLRRPYQSDRFYSAHLLCAVLMQG